MPNRARCDEHDRHLGFKNRAILHVENMILGARAGFQLRGRFTSEPSNFFRFSGPSWGPYFHVFLRVPG